MPAPAEEILSRREAVRNALRDLHSALLPVLDNMRGQEAARYTFQQSIKGDTIKIVVEPGKEE
jgi:hypothetical protein